MMRASFWIALITALFAPLYAPKLHLMFFAPYLVVCFYKKARYPVLWRALGCGLLIDLLTSTPLFGLTSLNYCLTGLILYGQRRNFFEDQLLTLPLMTFLFSMISSALTALLYVVFGAELLISWRWIITDLIEMPILDALYALLLFAIPFQLTNKITKMKWYDRFRKRHR